MNEPTIRLEVRPEVSSFVEKVRARLSDLSDEEREELVGGLEADIAELVSDGGSVSELGDPRAYADELRAAAGVTQRSSPVPGAGVLGGLRPRPRVAARIGEMVDDARRRWFELVAVPALRTSWELLSTLRPVWWVLRAWIAMQLLDMATQGGDLATPVPNLAGPVVGSLAWLVAIVVSVQIGRNRIWPGSGATRKTLARVVLLGLNAFAVVMMPVVLGQFPASGTWEYNGLADFHQQPPGLMNRGEYVQNVFAYDAQGQPLTGVQLFDQDGRPLRLARSAEMGWDDKLGDRWTVSYPWMNGGQQLYNVVPLAMRDQGVPGRPASAWWSENPPALPQPPLAVVPPVSLPGSTIADGTTTDEGETDATGSDADVAGSATETSQTKADEPPGGSGRSGKRDSEKTTGR